jgi:hypothetical protein
MEMTHNIPSLGRVDIQLGEYPTFLYKFLKQRGEVDRLTNLLHIGMLETCFPGMRHTRWDYTFAGLYVVDCLTTVVEGLTVNKRVNNKEISGRDMTQLMILASNIGHLPGTFIVEKGILRALLIGEHLHKLLKKAGLPKSTPVDYTTLNKVIGLIRLKEWISEIEKDGTSKTALDITYYLLSAQFFRDKGKQHFQKIKSYYRFSRRAAYQILDSLYVSLPYTIQYEKLIKKPPSRSPFSDEWSQMVDLLDDYTRIIYDNIYHSESSRKVIAPYSNKIFEYFKGMKNPINELLHLVTYSELPEIISYDIKDKYDHIVQVSIPHVFPLSFFTENICSNGVDELELELVGIDPQLRPSFLYIPGLKDELGDDNSNGELRFDICISNNSDKRQRHKALAIVLLWAHKFAHDWGSGTLYKGIMSGILEQACGNHKLVVKIEVAPNEVFTNKFIDENDLVLVPEDKIMLLRSNEKTNIHRAIKFKNNKNLDKSMKAKYHECKCLFQLALRKWVHPERGYGIYHLIIPGRVRFVDVENDKDVCEFDGVFLSIIKKRKKIRSRLFLLEAKSGRSRSQYQAKSELLKALGRLKGQYLQGRVFSLLKSNAYAEIRLA